MTAIDLTDSSVEYRNDDALLTDVLRPYKSHCKYLKTATITSAGGLVTARCELAIPESCYIDDTGHFNSVEFNICYNQMLYYIVAKSIREELTGVLRGWAMKDFWLRQLPDIYIADFRSTFRQPMRGGRFYGEIELTGAKERRGDNGRQPLIWLNTVCRFWDDREGKCDGQVLIAILNPPPKEK